MASKKEEAVKPAPPEEEGGEEMRSVQILDLDSLAYEMASRIMERMKVERERKGLL